MYFLGSRVFLVCPVSIDNCWNGTTPAGVTYIMTHGSIRKSLHKIVEHDMCRRREASPLIKINNSSHSASTCSVAIDVKVYHNSNELDTREYLHQHMPPAATYVALEKIQLVLKLSEQPLYRYGLA